MRKLLLMALIGVLLLTFFGCEAEVVTEKIETATSVEVQNPIEGSLTNETTIVGKLQASNSAVAVATVMGAEEIIAVNYEIGDYVEKGDIIVVLDAESSEDQAENARLSYMTAKRNYEAVKESLASAQTNLDRTQKLFDSGVVSQQQLDGAKLQASSGQLKTVESQMLQAKFAYENAQESVDQTVVEAPISGIISSLNFEESNMATSQNSLVVTDLETLKIDLEVTEDVINRLTPESTAVVSFETVDLEKTGDIVFVNPVADQRTGLYKISLSVDNSKMNLKSGMFARVKFSFDNTEAFLIPIDAVLSEDANAYVYIVVDNKPSKQVVELGEDDGEIVEILSGITAADLVIVKGQNYINEETDIQVVTGGN